eukprot:9479353-Pyramimonas_sp.AAC.1
MICTSNLDQSGSRGRAGVTPPCCRPRLALICGIRRWSSELPAPLEAGCPAAGSAARLPTVMSWRLAPAVGTALPGLGARSRTSGGAACAS